MSNKAIKYRIYPTKEQRELFIRTFGHSRFVYNNMLAFSKEAYEHGEKVCSRNKFNYRLTELKKEFPWLAEVDATALTSANDSLAAAFANFFGKRAMFPSFHKKRNYASYTSKRIHNSKNIDVGTNFVKLPKVGCVKAKIHRLPPENWTLKSATVSMKADGSFYASLLFEFEAEIPERTIDTNNSIGLDYKSDGLYTDSNGNIGSNHKYFREGYAKLLKEQKKLSRMEQSHIISYKVVGNKRYPVYDKPLSECKNYQKQRAKVAKIHSHIANQRLDNLHKLSAEIANLYDIVCVESLDMKAIANKGFGNGKATMDNGYGIFLRMLEYKLSDRGKKLIKIDKWLPSSQICHNCGALHKLQLNERTYKCECGYICDRDFNAAKNILREGLKLFKSFAA